MDCESLGADTFDGDKLVGVKVSVFIEDSALVDAVDAHLSRGVDDVFAVHHDAYMGDGAVVFPEKGEVAGSCFGQEIH